MEILGGLDRAQVQSENKEQGGEVASLFSFRVFWLVYWGWGDPRYRPLMFLDDPRYPFLEGELDPRYRFVFGDVVVSIPGVLVRR